MVTYGTWKYTQPNSRIDVACQLSRWFETPEVNVELTVELHATLLRHSSITLSKQIVIAYFPSFTLDYQHSLQHRSSISIDHTNGET